MKCWRDRKGVVHLLDGFDFQWCVPVPKGDPRMPNTSDVPTCLRCLGEWMNNVTDSSA